MNRYTITVLRDADLQAIVKELAIKLNGLLRFSIDAYFIAKSLGSTVDAQSGEEIIEEYYDLIYPNTWGSVNSTQFVYNNKELEDLLDEIHPDVFEKRLEENSLQRREVYKQSNVGLHRILAYQILVSCYPANMVFQ